MNILFLKGFNNYFNRIIVKYDTLLDYTQRSKSNVAYTNINFNSNDGTTTELIVGGEGQQVNGAPLDWETSGSPDYLVCYETDSSTAVDTIISRWFVIECQRTRLGQYRLTLKRDVIADNLTAVEDATCFINKGIIEDTEDPALFNKEEVNTNQIKSDEFLLKDETQCGWVVGYVAKDRYDGAGTLTPVSFKDQPIPSQDASDAMAEEVYNSETDFWNAHPELIGDLATLNSWKATVKVDIFYGRMYSYYKVGQTITCDNNGSVSYKESAYQNDQYLHSAPKGEDNVKMLWKAWIGDWRDTLAGNFVSGWKTSEFRNAILGQLESKEGINFKTESEMQAFLNFVKRAPVIKINGKFYKPYDIYGEIGNKSTITNNQFLTSGGTAFNLFYDNLDLTPQGVDGNHDLIVGNPGPETFMLEWSYNRHQLGLREIFSKCKAKVPAIRPVLKDAPYHMFAIPYSDNLTLFEGDTVKCVTNKSVAINAAQAIAQQAGAGVVYDIQLLPYCPVRDIIKTEKVTAKATVENPTYDIFYSRHYDIGQSSTFSEIPVAKLNHKYVIAKDFTVDDSRRAVGIRPHFNNNVAAGVLKVVIGANPENPTESYDAYGIEIKLADITDLTSAVKLNIYKSAESMNSNTPDVSLDYATYAAADYYIGFEATDNCDYAYVFSIPNPQLYWQYLPNGGIGVITRKVSISTTDWLRDYIYYDDYYLTKIDITNSIHSNIVQLLGEEEKEGNIVNMIFWCQESKFTFNKFMSNYFLLNSNGTYTQDSITELVEEKVKFGADPKDIKVRNQVEMMRLAAPNYSSFFDMNVQANKGMDYINVDCTYKPYQPYIHLNPNFNGLYGADYNDIRGLICGGDYSVAITTDAWATYQLQNKNYQAIFDRQAQQLEVQNNIQHQQDIVNAITGVGSATVGGAVSGALTGAKFGSPIAGAVVGAVGGFAGSTIGGMMDVQNNQTLRELQMSTMKDIHYMQLENIKALPIGLAKTSYLTNNNKLFPFLEFYTCTPTEEMAVRSLLDYNGMTINRIGKIKDFQSVEELPYIKAKLIRIDIVDDTHQVKAISDELATGVYLPKGDSDVVEGE